MWPEIEQLGGRVITAFELRSLSTKIPNFPEALATIMSEQPLIGLKFSLDEAKDRSGMGAEVRWMTTEEIVSEAFDAYPGIAAVTLGLIPVGICLEGTGDPYFYRAGDGALVRVPHEAAAGEKLDVRQIELVADSVEALVRLAQIERPDPG